MPQKRRNSPYWKVRSKNLPGFGDTGLLSTRTKRKARAEEMEDLLVYLADYEYYDLLEALRPVRRGASGRITLPELLRAKKEGRLEQLRRSLTDPPLEEAIRDFAQLITYQNHKLGLKHLLRLCVQAGGPELAPPAARLSWLTEPKHINTVTRFMIGEGYAPNTVRNGVWGALSKLFQHEYGKARASAILAEAERPSEDDSRDVWLAASDVRRVVSACEWEVRMYLILMAATGMDTAPMLRIRARDFDEDRWTLYVRDTKEAQRKRTLDLSPVATYCLKLLTESKSGGATAFTLSRGQISYRWRKARKAAGLTEDGGFPSNVRLKDLRHTFAVHYLRGGGNLAGLAGRMGHGREAQSLQYAKHEARGLEDMEQAAHAMGLRLPEELRGELGAAPERKEQKDEVMPTWWFDRNALPRDPEEGKELQATQRYQERGTAGYAEDPSAYKRQWHEEQKRKAS